jgi:phage baseplate assembly protein W
MAGLSPKLPIKRDKEDGYALTKSYTEMVTQNLKNLILTVPGERMMDPNFGAGIKRFLFEQHDVSTYSSIFSKIIEQATIYMPFIDIQEADFYGPLGRWNTNTGFDDTGSQPQADPNRLQMIIFFSITPIDEGASLNLDFAV